MIKVSQGCLGNEELAQVGEAFEYGYFGLAQKVIEFEEALKGYLGAPHVICTNTGTSALHLALDALGIGAGDEVIVPSLTFVASFQAIRITGATPIAVDVEPDTLLMDLADVERRITRRTKAIMPVHFAGNACDMEALFDLASRHGVRIVEDAAHAFGSTYKGRRIGGFGDVVCFSFDSIKNITCGEGGAIVCREDSLAELIRSKRVLGMNRKLHDASSWKERSGRFKVETLGFRYHMSNINAAIGLAQLKKVDGFIARRREISLRYDEAFAHLPGIQSLHIDYNECAPHIYVVRVKDNRRDSLVGFLRQREIESLINYTPNHLHPYFRQDDLILPETENAYKEILALPLHCALSDADVDLVIAAVGEFLKSPAEVKR